MRTTIIVRLRGKGYVADVSDGTTGRPSGARIGLTPYDAAANAAKLMLQFAQPNPEGGDLMAPKEVLELVPEYLRTINSSPQTTAQ